MRRAGYLAAVWALLAGAPVWAEPVATRLDRSPSEAADLRLDHWPSGGWAVQQFQRNVEIRFPGAELDIAQDAGVLDLLEGRLVSVEGEVRGGDSYLRLVLACDCGVVLTGNETTGIDLAIVGGTENVATVDVGPAPQVAPVPVDKRLPDTDVASAPQGPLDPAEVQERLLEQLRRAAEAGIVELNDDQSPVRADPAADQPDVETAAADTPAPAADVAPEASTSAETPDLHADPRPHEEPQVATGPVHEPHAEPVAVAPKCYHNEAFALPEVIGPSVFSEAVAAARAKLVGEFDRAQSDAAIELSQVYLASMAAEEARATLDTFAPGHPLAALYAEMTAVVLGEPLSADAALLKPECQGSQAVWRGFAQALMGDAAAALESEALAGRSLDRQPLILRMEMAAALGLAAADESDWTAARRYEALAQRAAIGAQLPSGNAMLLSARLAEWHGEAEKALDYLKQARDSSPGPVADKALIALADFALASATALGSDTYGLQTDLAALAHRMRGTELGADAFERQAHLHMLSASEDDTVAFVNAGVARGLYPPEHHAALLADLVSGAALTGLSRPLALIYLDAPERYAEAMEQAPFRRAVVRSLAEMGVPGMAEAIVQPDDLSVEGVAVPLGAAYLASGDARSALDVAQAMQAGPKRDELAAAALAALGQTDAEPQPSNTTPSVDVLEARLAKALEDGRLDAALQASIGLLTEKPDLASAERVALIALQSGATELPDEAARVIAAQAPDRLAMVQALFQPVPEGPDSEDPIAVSGFLDSLDAEISLIEEYLEDG